MKRNPVKSFTILAAMVLLPGFARAQDKAESAFLLKASGLQDGSTVPRRFICDDANVAHALNWSGEPEGTQSFALIAENQDTQNFNHWVLWDIPEPGKGRTALDQAMREHVLAKAELRLRYGRN